MSLCFKFRTISSLFLSLSICFFMFPAASVIWLASALKQRFPFRSNVRTPAKDSDSPLPSIHERLAHLRPSRELLDFYRQKIAQFDEEQAELQQMLERNRRSTEEQVRRSKSTGTSGGHLRDARPVLTPSPFSISCSGTYGSVRGRLWSCRML